MRRIKVDKLYLYCCSSMYINLYITQTKRQFMFQFLVRELDESIIGVKKLMQSESVMDIDRFENWQNFFFNSSLATTLNINNSTISTTTKKKTILIFFSSSKIKILSITNLIRARLFCVNHDLQKTKKRRLISRSRSQD